MKKETKEFLRNIFVGFGMATIITIAILGITLAVFLVVSHKSNEQTSLKLEIGMKISDLKWLARAGKISEEEVDEFNKSAQNLDFEELNQLLDDLLEGKEEEYLKEQTELHEKVQSILNK